MTSRPTLALTVLACAGVAGCASGTTPTSGHAASGARAATTTAAVASTAAPSPTAAVATPSPAPPVATPSPSVAAASPSARTHVSIAACHLLAPAQVASIAGLPLPPDPSLSATFPSFTASDGVDYVQDDCGFSSGATAVRVLVVEPRSSRRGTVADGREALQSTEDDLTSHGATLTPVPALGDTAVSWAPSGQGFAQVYVLDHDIVLGVGIEGVVDGDPLLRAERLARDELAAADSGTADGVPGS